LDWAPPPAEFATWAASSAEYRGNCLLRVGKIAGPYPLRRDGEQLRASPEIEFAAGADGDPTAQADDVVVQRDGN